MNQDDTCPNCGKPKIPNSLDCPSCGVVFAKLGDRLDEGPQNFASEEFHELWANLIQDYNNMSLHEEFIQFCMSKNKLTFASQQYRKMLEVNPHDELAKKMQNRIISLASIHFMTLERPTADSEDKKSTLSAILFIGSVLIVIGWKIEKWASVLYIGIILIVVSILLILAKKWRDSE